MRIWIESATGNKRDSGKRRQFTGTAHDFIDCTDEPAPTIMAGRPVHLVVEGGAMTDNLNPGKPPYRVPLMAEINALPWNSFTVASTFSGTGGSCLGYRMAGFKVVWANEFVPEAQRSYRANMAPGCLMDDRDIHAVQPEDLLRATGLAKGELDLFDGSPPCQAFSTAGVREKGWGKDRDYAHGASQKNETLFDEYIRLLRGLMPRTFVAENVSGLVKGTAKGYFLEILAALKASGYRVQAKLLDAQWLGVPQARQRVIFVGVRNDLGLDPAFPKPLSYRYSVREALPWIAGIVMPAHGFKDHTHVDGNKLPCPTVMATGMGSYGYEVVAVGGIRETGHQAGKLVSATEPSPTIMAGGGGGMNTSQFGIVVKGNSAATEKRKFSIAELKRICAFSDDFVLTGSYAEQWARLGNSVPPVMMSHIAAVIRDEILAKAR